VGNKYHELRGYIWKYFEYHASQRLTTFNFYIVISTLIATGYFLAIKEVPILSIVLSIFLILLSFIFWKLDLRNKQFIHYSEDALKCIESNDIIDENDTKALHIFTFEFDQTKELENKKKGFLNKPLLYSTCFKIVFISFGIFGVIALIMAIINLFYSFSPDHNIIINL
jgi:hypothetical protein